MRLGRQLPAANDLNRLRDGVKTGIRRRYAGSVLGPIWALLYPMALLTIYAALYAFVFQVRVPNMTTWEYIVMVFAGLVPLLAFSEMLNASTSSISSNRDVVMNMAYPVHLIPTRDALVAQVPGMFGLSITILLALVVGTISVPPLLLLPLLWIQLAAFTIGIGLVLSLVSIVVKDVQYALGLAVMLLFITSPFAYTSEMVPDALRPIIAINPLTYFVLSFQDIIAYGRFPDWKLLAVTLALSVGSLWLGWSFFSRARKVFFDYV